MTLALVVLPIFLLLLGAPIFVIFIAAVIAAVIFVLPLPPIILQQVMFGALDNYALLAVPFFLFAGELMARGQVAMRLVDFVQALIGRVPGSLGLTVVGSGTILGVISGSSPATVAAVGRTLYPSLIQEGYHARTAGGLVAASASVAIVLPPSIALILYGAAAEQSIPRLFMAGILPGLLISLLTGLAIIWIAHRHGYGTTSSSSLSNILRAAWRAAGALVMPLFILGGIAFGFFSPTEAGGFACLYALLISRFLYRSLSWSDVLDCAAEAVLLTAQILVIVAAAGLFSYVLTTQQVPQSIVQWVQSMDLGPIGFLLVVNILLLIIGCFIDPTSAILLLTPLFMPMVASFGIDPIHFGVLMIVNISIGMFTPPFGLNVFVAQSITRLPLKDIYLGVLPFVVVQILGLLVITYYPNLSLALARML